MEYRGITPYYPTHPPANQLEMNSHLAFQALQGRHEVFIRLKALGGVSGYNGGDFMRNYNNDYT